MKFLPILEPGDSFKTSEGKERTVWRATIVYTDSEGQQHQDVEPVEPVADLKACPNEFAHERLAKDGWTMCFACGNELPRFNAMTSDLL